MAEPEKKGPTVGRRFQPHKLPPQVVKTELIVDCVADIARKPLRWLVPKLLPLGKTVILAGDPGLGKSALSLDLAAAVTRGASRVPWEGVLQGDVVLLSAEDDVADTIRPRLEEAGADLSRVHSIATIRDTDDKGSTRDRSFKLTHDISTVRTFLQERQTGGRQVRLLDIDPISAYLGGIDSHRTSDVREVLAPWAAVAAEFELTILSVTHLTKGGRGSALYRINGSLAFGAAARAVFACVKDDSPENAPEADKGRSERRLFLPVKVNIAAAAKGWAYRTTPSADPDIVRIEWEPAPVTINVDDLLAEDSGRNEGRKARDAEAEEWLRETLADGAKAAKELYSEGESRGFSSNRLKHAKRVLGVQVQKFAEGWFWSLPPVPEATLGWLRVVALTAFEAGHSGRELSATALCELEAPPGVRTQDSLSVQAQAAGKLLGEFFRMRGEMVELAPGVTVKRLEAPAGEGSRVNRRYVFEDERQL